VAVDNRDWRAEILELLRINLYDNTDQLWSDLKFKTSQERRAGYIAFADLVDGPDALVIANEDHDQVLKRASDDDTWDRRWTAPMLKP